MSERHTAFGEKLRSEYEKRGADIDQIRLDARLDAILAKHNRISVAAYNLAMVCMHDSALLNAAMVRLIGAHAEGTRKESGFGGHVGGAGNGHSSVASEPLTDDGDGGHDVGARDGHGSYAASPSPQGDGMGQERFASNGLVGDAHPSSPLSRGAGATLEVPEGRQVFAPAAANPQREPSRATLAATHRTEMRAAKFILKLPDGRDITQIRLGEAAHYETKTSSEAVINYVMKVLRRDYATFDQSKFLGSDDKGAVPMVSLQRLIREAQEAIYGKAA